MAALLAAFCVLAAVTLAGAYQAQQALPPYVGKDLTEEEAAEVIARNSPLTSYVRLSPNADFPREEKITKITIHHMGADLTLDALGASFGRRDRGASANYGIDSDGNVGLYVEEANRSWQAPALKTIMRQSPLRSPTRKQAATGGSATAPMRRSSPCARTSAGATAWKNWSIRGMPMEA